MTDFERIKESGIELLETNDEYYITDGVIRFLVSRTKFNSGPFYLYTAIPDNSLLDNLPLIHIFSVLSAILSFLLVFCLLFVRWLVFSPLHRIIKVMSEFVNNNTSARMEREKGSSEFEAISDTFNNMLVILPIINSSSDICPDKNISCHTKE